MPNLRNISRHWIWWIAAMVMLLSELFVFLRTLPEKRRWAEEPVLTLELPAIPVAPEVGADAGGAVAGEYRFLDQPERLDGVTSQLSFSKGRCGVFYPLAEGNTPNRALDFFYFEYEPGNPRFLHDVFGHAPEVCMRATGATLRQEHARREIVVLERTLPVRVLEFLSPVSSVPMWVFQLTWLPEDVPYAPYEAAYTLRQEKLRSGLFGSPKPPARVLLAGAMGYQDLESAWASYEELLVSRLQLVSR